MVPVTCDHDCSHVVTEVRLWIKCGIAECVMKNAERQQLVNLTGTELGAIRNEQI